jgi:hypothetical protein
VFRIQPTQNPNRQFLLDHVERMIFDHYNVTVVGSVPLQTATEHSKLAFRIEGSTIDGLSKSIIGCPQQIYRE